MTNWLGRILLALDGGIWLAPLVVPLRALLTRHWRAAALLVLATCSSIVGGSLLELLVARPKPALPLVQVYVRERYGFSFPETTGLVWYVLLGCLRYWLCAPRLLGGSASSPASRWW